MAGSQRHYNNTITTQLNGWHSFNLLTNGSGWNKSTQALQPMPRAAMHSKCGLPKCWCALWLGSILGLSRERVQKNEALDRHISEISRDCSSLDTKQSINERIVVFQVLQQLKAISARIL